MIGGLGWLLELLVGLLFLTHHRRRHRVSLEQVCPQRAAEELVLIGMLCCLFSP